jgi:hypothetical protein
MGYQIGVDLTVIDTSPQFKLGELAQQDDGKIYKYVKYEAATAATAGVAGEVAYYATVAVGDATGTIVTSDLSDSNEIGAGVLQAALTDGTYGWVQVKGIAKLTIALTAGADGRPLTAKGATDGTLDVTSTVSDVVCAVAIDVSEKIIMCDFPH